MKSLKNLCKVRKRDCRWITGIIALLLCFCVSVIGPARAQDEGGQKTLHVSGDAGQLKVVLKPTKSSYQVGEPIKFTIKGNKDFFLYLITINKRQNRAVVLIPSAAQKGNKYKANRRFIVPNPGLEFYADKPGIEQVIMVASTRYIDLKTNQFNKSGPFYTGSAAVGEAEFKDLRLRSNRIPRAERTVQEISLNIESSSPTLLIAPQQGRSGVQPPAATAPPRTSKRAIVFLACDQDSYRVGDLVHIIYGADHPGWVNLYVYEPGGKRSLLKKEKVSGKEVYRAAARAEYPLGEHTLMAVYSDGADLPEKSIPSPDETGGKGLTLVSPEEPPHAVFHFRIAAE